MMEITQKALRYNEGKPKYSLLDLNSMKHGVQVLEFGANKYSNYDFFSIFAIEQKLNQLCVKNAKITLKKSSQKDYVALVTGLKTHRELNAISVENLDYFLENLDYVDPVMKKTDLIIDLKKLKQKENIKKSIILNQKILLKSETDLEKEVKTLSIKNKLKEQHSYLDFLNMDLQKNNIILFVNEDVEYVEVKKDFTLIMTIQLENLEIYCVVNVTKELDCYKILLKLLKKLLNISLDIHDICNFTSGKDNWKKGMPITQILDSMLRHIAALQSGEWLDPESGLPHIGHIQCNALFLGGPNVEIDIEELKQESNFTQNCCGNWDNDGKCKCNE
jgi:hypothetical protein